MARHNSIPVFTLFGETSRFPDMIHCERIWDRARLHDWVISPHRHHELTQVFLMQQGKASVRVDGVDSTLETGGFLCIPAGAVHGFTFQKGCEGLVLSFTGQLVRGMARASPDLAQALRQSFCGPIGSFGMALADEIASCFARTGTFRATELVALSHAFLARLAAQSVTDAPAPEIQPPADKRISRFETLIAAHLTENWGPRDYAQALAITPGHLNRICRAAYGQTASAYLESHLMIEAARLLAFTRMGTAEIGYRLGFEDPSYFSRRFRLRRGETPSAYRARITT